MKLRMDAVAILVGSTIGFGRGVPIDDSTKRVTFAMDWRSALKLGELMMASDDFVVAEVEAFQILRIEELPPAE